MHRDQLISITILLLYTTSSLYSVKVYGDVPAILSFELDEESDILIIEVRHQNHASNHYVDEVQVEVDGEVESINLSESQSSSIFSVEYETAGDYDSIRARAHCNVHGWRTGASSQWITVMAEGSPGSSLFPSF